MDEWPTKPHMDENQVQNLHRRGGTRQDVKTLVRKDPDLSGWRDGKTTLFVARFVEASIRQGCPSGYVRKSVKNSQSIRIPRF